MIMGDVGTFLAMGGYAVFVWPAYGLALAVLGGLTAHSSRRYRRSIVALERLQQDRGSRR
jgi:heme exporter protein D